MTSSITWRVFWVMAPFSRAQMLDVSHLMTMAMLWFATGRLVLRISRGVFFSWILVGEFHDVYTTSFWEVMGGFSEFWPFFTAPYIYIYSSHPINRNGSFDHGNWWYTMAIVSPFCLVGGLDEIQESMDGGWRPQKLKHRCPASGGRQACLERTQPKDLDANTGRVLAGIFFFRQFWDIPGSVYMFSCVFCSYVDCTFELCYM